MTKDNYEFTRGKWLIVNSPLGCGLYDIFTNESDGCIAQSLRYDDATLLIEYRNTVLRIEEEMENAKTKKRLKTKSKSR